MEATLTPTRPSVAVVRISDEESDAIAHFMQRAWNANITGASVRRARAEASRRNPIAPGTDIPAVVYLHEGNAIGHLGTIPVKFWNGRFETAGHWLKGLMVLPEHRNGPVGFNVLKELLRHVDVCGAMVVASQVIRLFKALGFVDCGAVRDYVALLRPGRVASRVDIESLDLGVPAAIHGFARLMQSTGVAHVFGGALGLATHAQNALSNSPRRFNADLSGSLPPASELETLWERSASMLGAAAVRDSIFMQWRYDADRGSVYECVSIRNRATKEIAALAIVKRPGDEPDPRLRGLKVAVLTDILFRSDDPRAGLAAMAGAEAVARRMEADALVCSTSHPTIASLLRRRSYFGLSDSMHLMLRDPGGKAQLPTAAKDWWLMRGDANSDDAF